MANDPDDEWQQPYRPQPGQRFVQPSESGLEIQLHAQYSSKPSVYVLMVLEDSFVRMSQGRNDIRLEFKFPRPVVFSTSIGLKGYVVQQVLANMESYPDTISFPLKKFAELNEYGRFFKLWRHAQSSIRKGGFDAYWNEEPNEIL
jgi:hypothetical protein